MTPSSAIRPVLVLLLAAGLGACGVVESDAHRFENLAERVASVPLNGGTAERGAGDAARPALQVEVMDPHALWDARDGLVGRVVHTAAPRVAEAAAPAVIEAAARQLSDAVPRPAPAGPLVQLGAFSSEAGAREAWARLQAGPAGSALHGLTPVFEPTEVGGRALVRLKVPAPQAGAAALCAAAGVDDPWCRRIA